MALTPSTLSKQRASSTPPTQPIIAAHTASPNPMEIHQTTIPWPRHNHSWGDTLSLPKPITTLCITSHNVNSLSPQCDYVQWKAATHTLQTIEADVVSLKETNLMWNKVHWRSSNKFFIKLLEQLLSPLQPAWKSPPMTTNATALSKPSSATGYLTQF